MNCPTTIFTPLEFGTIGLSEDDAQLIFEDIEVWIGGRGRETEEGVRGGGGEGVSVGGVGREGGSEGERGGREGGGREREGEGGR